MFILSGEFSDRQSDFFEIIETMGDVPASISLACPAETKISPLLVDGITRRLALLRHVVSSLFRASKNAQHIRPDEH